MPSGVRRAPDPGAEREEHGPTAAPASGRYGPLLDLQRRAGNTAVSRLVASGAPAGTIQRMSVLPAQKTAVDALNTRYLTAHADDYAGWNDLVKKATDLKDLTQRVDVIAPVAAGNAPIAPVLKADDHGKKHTKGSNQAKKKLIEGTTNGGAATFTSAYASAYESYLFRVIRSAHAVNPMTSFVDMGASCGYDDGTETTCVELYYNGDIGSHMRPKRRDYIKTTIAPLLP